MAAIEPGKYRIQTDEIYARALEILKSQDRVRDFVMEDGVLKEMMGERRVECIPFSKVRDQIPPGMSEFGMGDGPTHLVEHMVSIGFPKGEAQWIAKYIYKFVPPWITLPVSMIDKFPSQMKGDRFFLEPGTFAKVDAFVNWLNDLQAEEPDSDSESESEPAPVDEATQKHRDALKAHAEAFQKRFTLMSDETFEGWMTLVKGKPGQTHTKQYSCYKEPWVYRVEGDRIFVNSAEFSQEKECLRSTAAQPHFPEGLQKFGYGDGPDHLFEGLLKRGMEAEKAEAVTKHLYSMIRSTVILPEKYLDRIVTTSVGNVILTDAEMINKARDFGFWLQGL